MPQPRLPAFSFTGPFMGLNTTHDPRHLAPGFAARCRNLLLSEGYLRPRPPLKIWGVPFGAYRVPLKPISLFVWQSDEAGPAPASDSFVIAQATDGVDLVYMSYPFGVNGLGDWRVMNFAQGGINRGFGPASYVVFGNQLYIADGGHRVLRFDRASDRMYNVGIQPPGSEAFTVWGLLTEAGPGITPGDLQFAVTYFDVATGFESNPLYSPIVSVPFPPFSAKAIGVVYNGPPATRNTEGITHFRIYKRNLSTKEVGYRLCYTAGIDHLGEHKLNLGDGVLEQLGISTASSGPWAPSLNGLPPEKTTTVYAFQGRMWYASTLADDLYFSAPGVAAHVDSSPLTGSFRRVGESDGIGITGLAEVSGSLVIGKPRALWLLGGQVTHQSNEEVATGVPAPAPTDQLIRSRSDVGCANRGGGNGLIAAAGGVYFNADSGFFRFNGDTSVVLTDLIKPTWLAFARGQFQVELGEQNQRITYALDRTNGILYMCQSNALTPYQEFPFGKSPVPVLAYHYGRDRGDGVGVWSEITHEPGGRITCVAGVPAESIAADPSVPQTPAEDKYRAEWLAGLVNFVQGAPPNGAYLCSDRYPDNAAADWEYASPAFNFAAGLRQLVHWLRILHLEAVYLPNEGVPAGFGMVDVSCRSGDAVLRTAAIDLKNGVHTAIVVQAAAEDLQVILSSNADWVNGWDPSVLIRGVQIDFEPIGEF
jgi:hypothetical protein